MRSHSLKRPLQWTLNLCWLTMVSASSSFIKERRKRPCSIWKKSLPKSLRIMKQSRWVDLHWHRYVEANYRQKLASLYSQSIDTRSKSFIYFDKLKRLMKQYRTDEVGPGRDLRENEYMSDYEVLIEWAYRLEDSDPALATKCNSFSIHCFQIILMLIKCPERQTTTRLCKSCVTRKEFKSLPSFLTMLPFWPRFS